MRNRGFNWEKELAEQSSEDWPLGATGLTCIAEIPLEDKEFYLPKGELQFGREDFMSCVSIGILNILASKFTYLIDRKKLNFNNHAWLLEKGYIVDGKIDFSDRFIAILSNTTRDGNSLKAPLDAVRYFGLIPKSLLPTRGDMTFDEYHDRSKITATMTKLGEDFKSRFFINYERGREVDFAFILKRDSILVGAYAWPVAVNGIYPRVNDSPNHAFMVFRPRYFAFDNYDEDKGPKEDWIKQLAGDYDFIDTGYRILINKEAVTPQKKTLWDLLRGYVRDIIK